MIPIVALWLTLAAMPIATSSAPALVTTAEVRDTGEIHGSWTASAEDSKPGRLSFSFRSRRDENNGAQFPLSDFTGLDDAVVRSASQAAATFRLEREAGTFAFEGSFRDGFGAGSFRFTPNAEYPRSLRALGVEFRAKDGETHELMMLAMFDVSTAFIRSMHQAGYDVSLDKYVEFRIFAVDPAYVRDMASVGFRDLSADKLVETRIHGATPDYIRAMRKSGDDLTLDQYIESRIFQVTPEFAAEMTRAGYPGLGRETLVQFKIHGVTPEFIADLRQEGYTAVPAQKLVEMRIYDVSPEFIRRVDQAGYHHVPIDKLVQMRIFHIEPEMVKALDDSDEHGEHPDDDDSGDEDDDSSGS